MKPSLVFMMRLSGSVKFFCALGRLFGWRGGGLARFLAALGLSPLLGLGLRFGLGRRGRFRLGLQFGLRRPDLLDALLLVGDPFGQLLAALVAAEGSVFLGVRSLGCAQPPLDLGLAGIIEIISRSEIYPDAQVCRGTQSANTCARTPLNQSSTSLIARASWTLTPTSYRI